MANLKLKNPSGGSLNFASADSASDLTVTFPAVTGTAMVSGNMPAFSVYKSASTQTPTSGVFTKVTFDVELFDTNNNFASDRFTPTVAGYYQINSAIDCGSASITRAIIAVYKNGSAYQYSGAYLIASSTEFAPSIATVVYCNGSSDYIEIYGRIDGGTVIFYNGAVNTWFNGVLIRSA